MNIVQFMRILWARKLLVVATTVSCLLGAFIMMQTLPARWDAHAQVLLNTLKPDPATGQLMVGPTEKNYVETQVALIRDYAVAGQVPPEIGWLTDPSLIEAYNHRSRHDVRDYRHWLAQIITDNTKATLLDGSNILQITYTSSDPTQAKTIVDDLRQAYLNATLDLNRTDALRDASWNEDQAAKARISLDHAIAEETAYERENGILMADAKVDVDTARLRAMSAQGAPIMAVTSAASSTPAMDQLSQVDATLAQDQGKLGPNHPEIQALEAKKAALIAIVSREKAASDAAASGTSSEAAATQSAINAQKARVLNESPKLGRLQQLQTDVDVKQDQYNRIMARVGELQQQAAVVSAGLTPLGAATTGNKASYPNKPLILIGGFALGLGVGLCLAILGELLDRRVRSPEDLVTSTQAPMFAVIPTPPLLSRWQSSRLGSRPRRGRSMVVPT